MKIWLIQIAEVLPFIGDARKMRTAMLADALIDSGHEVLWWTSAFDHFNKKWIFKRDTSYQIQEGYKFIALKGCGYNKNISLSRYVDHRLLARKFQKRAKEEEKPDVIVSSMPPHDVAYAATMYAKKNNIPIIIDIRDPWPDVFLKILPRFLSQILYFVFHRDFHMAKITMSMADGLVGISQNLLKFGLSYAGREAGSNDRVFYIGALKGRTTDQAKKKIISRLGDISDKFIVIFIGTLGHFNNPEILIDCARRLERTKVLFVIAGDGELYDKIEKEASKISNVVLLGWLNQEEILALLDIAHIGICPTPVKREDAFHNKVFLYLSAGLPIISAFEGELKETMEKKQFGLYYEPGNIDMLTSIFEELMKNPILYDELSFNAIQAFNSDFDALKIYKEYAEYVEKIAILYNNKEKRT